MTVTGTIRTEPWFYVNRNDRFFPVNWRIDRLHYAVAHDGGASAHELVERDRSLWRNFADPLPSSLEPEERPALQPNGYPRTAVRAARLTTQFDSRAFAAMLAHDGCSVGNCRPTEDRKN